MSVTCTTYPDQGVGRQVKSVGGDEAGARGGRRPAECGERKKDRKAEGEEFVVAQAGSQTQVRRGSFMNRK